MMIDGWLLDVQVLPAIAHKLQHLLGIHPSNPTALTGPFGTSSVRTPSELPPLTSRVLNPQHHSALDGNPRPKALPQGRSSAEVLVAFPCQAHDIETLALFQGVKRHGMTFSQL